jgi:hypothetical protein
MLRLDRVIKPWKESASLNDHINLYGFWNETTFLTKSGDLGMVLHVPGVDYERAPAAQRRAKGCTSEARKPGDKHKKARAAKTYAIVSDEPPQTPPRLSHRIRALIGSIRRADIASTNGLARGGAKTQNATKVRRGDFLTGQAIRQVV